MAVCCWNCSGTMVMFRFKVFDYLSGLSLEAPFHWPTVAFRISSNGSPFPFPMFCSSLNIDQMQSCMKVRNQPWKSIFLLCDDPGAPTSAPSSIVNLVWLTWVWPCKNIFHIRVLIIYLLFCNPAHKTKTRTANRWELLIANHLNQSLWSANRKQGSPVKSYLLHSSLGGAQLCSACYQPLSKVSKSAGAKPAYFDFSSCNCNVTEHQSGCSNLGNQFYKPFYFPLTSPRQLTTNVHG